LWLRAEALENVQSACMSTKTQLTTLAIIGSLLGVVLVVLGIGAGGPLGTFILGLGVAAIVLACVAAIATCRWLRPNTRLPDDLRDTAPKGDWKRNIVSLELSDGRRITCVVVRHGGYIVPRKTDPPFNASDVVAIVPATEADYIAEHERQSIRP
jgi:hypothetical protein